MIELFLFGSPRLFLSGKPIQMDTRKALALLAFLVMSGVEHSRDWLATFLWPEYEQSKARASLRRTLSTLTRAISPDHLLVSRESIAIPRSEMLWCDILEFQRLLSTGGDSVDSCDEFAACLENAVSLYRDDFMAGFTLRDSVNFDDWQVFQSEKLRQDLAHALEQLVRCKAESGDYNAALGPARRWLNLDPLNEIAHRQLMRLYSWSGQRTAALRQYQACVRTLERELGVKPLEETTRLHQAILDERLEKPIQPSHFHGSPRPPSTSSLAVSSFYISRFPLVGRQAEWNILLTLHEDSRQDGRLCLLEGEIGIGKTRLAEEFITQVSRKGARVFQTQCYEGEANLAYGPFLNGFQNLINQPEVKERLSSVSSHWLSEAARLVPELAVNIPNLTSPPLLDNPGAQAHFYEGLCVVLLTCLTGELPGILFIDDLHWADSASLDLLAYLARRLKQSPLFILATYRSDKGKNQERLLSLKSDIARSGMGRCLGLDRLAFSDLKQLLTSIPDYQQSRLVQLSKKLYEESEGLPLFVIHYIEALLSQSDEQLQSDWTTPRDIQDVIRARLAGLEETAHQLLGTAAVIGRSFDFTTLHKVSGRSEDETVAGLETLLTQGLIREHHADNLSSRIIYDFTHEKLRELVYQDLSLTRRRLLHRRVAEALAGESPRHFDRSLAAVIASHFLQAGDQQQAVHFFRIAGEHARSLYANQEAIQHFQSALAAEDPDQAWLYEAIADLHVVHGDYPAAITNYDKAVDQYLSETSSSTFHVNLSRLDHKLGNLYHRLGNWDSAEQHFDLAITLSTDEERPLKHALIYADWSRTAHARGNLDHASMLANQSLKLAAESRDSLALAQAYNILGMISRSQGDHTDALSHFQSSLDFASRISDLSPRIAAMNNLAHLKADSGAIEEAIQLTRDALEICSRIGDRHRAAALHNHLADLFHACLRPDDAMEHLKQAVTLFTEIGSLDPTTIEAMTNPSIWMLTEW